LGRLGWWQQRASACVRRRRCERMAYPCHLLNKGGAREAVNVDQRGRIHCPCDPAAFPPTATSGVAIWNVRSTSTPAVASRSGFASQSDRPCRPSLQGAHDPDLRVAVEGARATEAEHLLSAFVAPRKPAGGLWRLSREGGPCGPLWPRWRPLRRHRAGAPRRGRATGCGRARPAAARAALAALRN
jgi:hypothetical protein